MHCLVWPALVLGAMMVALDSTLVTVCNAAAPLGAVEQRVIVACDMPEECR